MRPNPHRERAEELEALVRRASMLHGQALELRDRSSEWSKLFVEIAEVLRRVPEETRGEQSFVWAFDFVTRTNGAPSSGHAPLLYASLHRCVAYLRGYADGQESTL